MDVLPTIQHFSSIHRKFGKQGVQKNLKKITYICNERMEFSFKDLTNGVSDAAGCSPYVLVSVA